MTIIAGFRCDEGIVICADTQETLGTAKRNVPKLRFEPCDQYTDSEDHRSNLAAAFCGAGSGPFIDKLVDVAWNAAKQEPDLAKACGAIEAGIKQQYREFGAIYQVGACPEVQLIYGVRMNGASRLFTAMGPIVNEKYEYDSGGQGHYMADFLASKMHSSQLTIRQCVIVAAYVLHQAKEYVDGCGGESLIAVLRNVGTCGKAWLHRLEHITEMVSMADGTAGDILMALADLDESDEKVLESIQFHIGLMMQIRESHRKQIKSQEAPELYSSVDLLGLPFPKKPESQD